ncbi:MAG: carbon starvation protein A [Thermoguttaceae bacterium]|jgi:carbon starvation protein|nr:carbon starvation protein A [Thermoguttaceae bacterium]
MFDNAAVVTVLCFAAFVVAFFTYGRFLARRIYRLEPDRPTPSHTRKDGIDFVPTRVPILFGHHFASIAGLGPILGPAIAVIWGWVPAVLWVMFGCIFIGAVHDLGALVVSLRHDGRTIGDVCRDLMGPRARLLSLLIIFFLMSLAMGAFVITISDLFVNYNPDAIIPSFGLMLVAVTFGIAVYRFRVALLPATVAALVLFAGFIYWGLREPVATYAWFAPSETRQALDAQRDAKPSMGDPGFGPPYGARAATAHLAAIGNQAAAKNVETAASTAVYGWVAVLLTYAFLASVLPVWLLLQPRDYINSFQLYFALATMLLGLIVAGLLGAPENRIDAEPFRMDVPGSPPWFPFLFVTIACGAVSGFHSLVSSGTTVRQINRESDALPIGYGAMLVEGALAVLVIMACVAGLGAAAWQSGGPYSSWAGIGKAGLATQLNAVVRGGANFLGQIGIPLDLGQTVLAVTVVAFALTTLDSATRLLRFNVEEILRSVKLDPLANRYTASLIAVGGIAFFALVPAGKTLWTLFGTTNQLLAGLSLLTVSVFLYKLGRPVVYTLVPMLAMLVVSMWAMILSIPGFWSLATLSPWQKWSLTIVSIIVIAMALWLTVEALLAFARRRSPPETPAETQPEACLQDADRVS